MHLEHVRLGGNPPLKWMTRLEVSSGPKLHVILPHKDNLRSSGGHGRSAVTSRGGGGAGADVFERSQSVEGDTYVHRTDTHQKRAQARHEYVHVRRAASARRAL